MLSHIKISKKSFRFGDIKIEENNFYYSKIIFLMDVDIERVLVSNKISLDEKKQKILYWLLIW